MLYKCFPPSTCTFLMKYKFPHLTVNWTIPVVAILFVVNVVSSRLFDVYHPTIIPAQGSPVFWCLFYQQYPASLSCSTGGGTAAPSGCFIHIAVNWTDHEISSSIPTSSPSPLRWRGKCGLKILI